MKKIYSIAALSIFLVGCTMNPNKEARIERLETDTQQTIEIVKKLEERVQALEIENEQSLGRIIELESH